MLAANEVHLRRPTPTRASAVHSAIAQLVLLFDAPLLVCQAHFRQGVFATHCLAEALRLLQARHTPSLLRKILQKSFRNHAVT